MPCARHYSKLFMYILSSSPINELFFFFNLWDIWGIERLNNFPKVTQGHRLSWLPNLGSFFCFFVLAALGFSCSMWHLSFLTMDRTYIPCKGFLTNGPPGKSYRIAFIRYCLIISSPNPQVKDKLSRRELFFPQNEYRN